MATITILDGDSVGQPEFQGALGALREELQSLGHRVQHIALRQLRILSCTGCFECWIKTPGVCAIRKDDVQVVLQAWLEADLMIFASPLQAGFVSSLLKTSVDRFLPFVHPYFTLIKGEMTHRHRYKRMPLLASFLSPGPKDDARDLQITANWVRRCSQLNGRPFALAATTEQETSSIAKNLDQALREPGPLSVNPAPAPVPIVVVEPRAAQKLLVIHGSSRVKSNTTLLVQHLSEGFEEGGGSVSVMKLRSEGARKKAQVAFEEADLVLFAMPLYVHAMPGAVQAFFEMLERSPPRPSRRVAFLVQQGFYGAHHARWLEQHLALLPSRWGSQYLGTVIRGGVEGINEQPESWREPVFSGIKAIGKTLVESRLDPEEVTAFASQEYMGFALKTLMRVLTWTGLSNQFWDKQLKENGAYTERFAHPLRSPEEVRN